MGVHEYVVPGLNKRAVDAWIAIVALLFSLALSAAFQQAIRVPQLSWIADYPILASTITMAGMYGTLHAMFCRAGWRHPWIKRLVPGTPFDLTGTWYGWAFNDDYAAPDFCVWTVEHYWDRISLNVDYYSAPPDPNGGPPPKTKTAESVSASLGSPAAGKMPLQIVYQMHRGNPRWGLAWGSIDAPPDGASLAIEARGWYILSYTDPAGRPDAARGRFRTCRVSASTTCGLGLLGSTATIHDVEALRVYVLTDKD